MSVFIKNNNKFKTKANDKDLEKYKIINKIGSGGFGTVFLIESIKTKKKYALKIINISNQNEEETKKIISEAFILQKLDHPNIINLKEFYLSKSDDEEGQLLNIITEYADAGDLSKQINEYKLNNKLFEEKRLIDYLTQICLSLEYLHQKKILHRDIKPNNIFLMKNDIIKLGDFGVSKTLKDTLDKAKSFKGTPYYISPEIIEGKEYSFNSDIWSLGITFYYLMTFKHPLDFENLPGLFFKLTNNEKINPIFNNYSNDLKQLIYSMLDYEPTRRPLPHKILKLPFIRKRMKEFLQERNYNEIMSSNIVNNYVNKKQSLLTIIKIKNYNIPNKNEESLKKEKEESKNNLKTK